MKLIIVTGLSGAGKTIALNSLEDIGAYCVDNLPVGLLPDFAKQVKQSFPSQNFTAVGVDARTTALDNLPALLKTLDDTSIPYEILFLEADDKILIKRFSETRRRHPLTFQRISLTEAIQHERKLLAPLANYANIRINTSHMHVHQLRDAIRLRVGLYTTQTLALLFQSFGFKYATPSDSDFIFDVRCLANPHWEPHLRSFTGLDEPVIHFLKAQPKVQQMITHLSQFLEIWLPEFITENRSYLSVAIGCTGGHHRSVYIAEQLAYYFKYKTTQELKQKLTILVRHRELLSQY